MTGPIPPNGPLSHSLPNLLQKYRKALSTGPGQAPAAKPDNAAISPSAREAQRTLDGVKADVARAMSARGGGSGFSIEDVSTAMARFRAGRADLEPGQVVDLNVEVTASAQRAGLYLSFGGWYTDFLAGSSFTLDIGGTLGSRELSFASGTSIHDIAAAIDTFRAETGVTAVASGTGVVLRSTGYGGDEFVSVRAGGDADFGVRAGLYRLSQDDANAADAGTNTAFSNAASPILDVGQDVAALINGLELIGRGTLLTYDGPFITAQLDLKAGALADGETANAQNLGSFLAARIRWSDADGRLSPTPPGIDVSG